jgi:uridine kinase
MPSAVARRVISALGRWQAARPGVLTLAIDGHGGAGKSTLAAAVARATGAALVHTDDFFLRPAASATPPALVEYYDWRRLRAQALEPLTAGGDATFRRFDWKNGTEPGGTGPGGTGPGGTEPGGTGSGGTEPGGTEPGGVITVRRNALIVVEGVYSAGPELSDLVDRSVLVDTPEPERLRRLRARVTPEEWDCDWLAAEQAYFGAVRPPRSFDLIVSGTSVDPPASGR